MFAKPRPYRRYPVARQIRLRRWVRLALLAFVLFAGSSAVLDRGGWFKYRGDDWANFDKQACRVVSVADGDTLTLRPPGGSEPTRVRLLGIDAPEMRPKGGGGPAHGAADAKSYLTARTRERDLIVRLEQTQTRDRYGRLLAYLYLDEGDNLNLDLVRDGRAYADRRFEHAMKPQFEQAENEARKKGRGLWKDVTEEQMPAWRQAWLAKQRSK